MTTERSPLLDDSVELSDAEVVLAEYRQALNWMASHTKVSPFCRWRQYEKLIASIVDRVKHQNHEAPEVAAVDVRNAYYEVVQLRTIYRQFKNSGHPALKNKLALIAKGNVAYTEEKNDARARDTAFELFLAATFMEAGLQVSLGNETTQLEDLRIITDDFDLYVECKRPRSEASVRDCTDVAFKQLSKRLGLADRTAFGAVAFAIDRVKNPTAAYIKTEASKYIQEALASRTAEFVTANLGYWNLNRPNNVVLAFVQLCGSAYVGDLQFGIFSPIVTIERFPPLLTENGLACLKAIDHIFETLDVNRE